MLLYIHILENEENIHKLNKHTKIRRSPRVQHWLRLLLSYNGRKITKKNAAGVAENVEKYRLLGVFFFCVFQSLASMLQLVQPPPQPLALLAHVQPPRSSASALGSRSAGDLPELEGRVEGSSYYNKRIGKNSVKSAFWSLLSDFFVFIHEISGSIFLLHMLFSRRDFTSQRVC